MYNSKNITFLYLSEDILERTVSLVDEISHSAGCFANLQIQPVKSIEKIFFFSLLRVLVKINSCRPSFWKFSLSLFVSAVFLLLFDIFNIFLGLHDLHLFASLFVRLVDQLLPKLFNGFLYELFVVMQRYWLEVDLMVSKVGEDFIVQELSWKREAVNVF